MHAPGVEVRPLKQITGSSEFAEIFFTNVSVPAENIIGNEGQGWSWLRQRSASSAAGTRWRGLTRHQANMQRLIGITRFAQS